MHFLATNIMTRLLLLLVLSVFIFDVVYVEILSEDHLVKKIELPFDAEEEEEKSEEEKELSDKLIATAHQPDHFNSGGLNYFIYHNDYGSIPREIVTPPPDQAQ